MELDRERSKKFQKPENTTYTYSKLRASFGRWCLFHDHETEVNIDIRPNENFDKIYGKMDQIEQGIQACPQMSLKEINTSHIKNTTSGVNHVEGGWPKDISYLDQDQTLRYRKKAEREESYIPTMQNLCKMMEECIEQNNSIDIYVRYFSKEPIIDHHPDISAFVALNTNDPSGQKRAVSSVSWHPTEGRARLLVSHCDLDFMEVVKSCNDSYIWRIENPFQPEQVLSSNSPMLVAEYNHKDVNIVAGGQHNGQVAFFDIRRSIKTVGLTEKPVSHGEAVTSFSWIQSKTGFECFTTSSDGQILWWDMRNLSERSDQMVINHTKNDDLGSAEGGMVLEYSNSVPIKFMVGTEAGNVYSCTRKAKTSAEKLGTVFSEHLGPIYLLQRNPYSYKLFLTVGDYHADIWAEEFSHSPIWKTPMYNSHALHGGWSPPRPCVFFITKADGTLDVWDLTYRQKGPEYSMKLADNRLFCMSVEEKGEFVAVGSESGETYVVQLSSEVFEPQSGEKNFFTSMIDREIRREKFLYEKEKDKKFAKALQSQLPEYAKEPENIQEVLDRTTVIFYQTIEEEMRRLQKLRSTKVNQEEVVTAPTEAMDKYLEEVDEKEAEEEEVESEGLPSDPDLPLYQAESFAEEAAPDQPMEPFSATIHRKRFRIGHCPDIDYKPDRDIDFRKLPTCDCPALLPYQSAVDEEDIVMPTVTKVTPRRVYIREPQPEEIPEAAQLDEKSILMSSIPDQPDLDVPEAPPADPSPSDTLPNPEIGHESVTKDVQKISPHPSTVSAKKIAKVFQSDSMPSETEGASGDIIAGKTFLGLTFDYHSTTSQVKETEQAQDKVDDTPEQEHLEEGEEDIQAKDFTPEQQELQPPASQLIEDKDQEKADASDDKMVEAAVQIETTLQSEAAVQTEVAADPEAAVQPEDAADPEAAVQPEDAADPEAVVRLEDAAPPESAVEQEMQEDPLADQPEADLTN